MSVNEEWKLVSNNRRSKNYFQDHIINDATYIPPWRPCRYVESRNFSNSRKYSYKKRPIMSYGIILFTITEINGEKVLQYLVSQRRDTVEYVDFIRGQYNASLLKKFFSLMTITERERLKQYPFEELWKDLWINRNHRIFTDCYQKASQKFHQIKDQIPELLRESPSHTTEPSWGFPKGKKNAKESPIECALREFSEETRLDSNNIEIVSTRPAVEIYKGSNDKLYGTNYYLAFTPKSITAKRISTDGIRKSTVSEELGDLQWFTLEEAKIKLNSKRSKLIEYVDKLIKDRDFFGKQ